jgi:hypothetical protein
MPNKPGALAAVRSEVGDVLLYLIGISDKLGIDLIAGVNAKITLNAANYPVDKARGSSREHAVQCCGGMRYDVRGATQNNKCRLQYSCGSWGIFGPRGAPMLWLCNLHAQT